MYIERITLTNFRSFGPSEESVALSSTVTACVGGNGSGKTALMHALLRMFGVTADQRRVRRHDFHVPADEGDAPQQRKLSIEAVLAFPELAAGKQTQAIPEFFNQMAADDQGTLRARLRLEATWTDDNSVDGVVETRLFAVKTFEPKFKEEDCVDIRAHDRARIQVIYVPAVRDAASHLSAFLRGRLWRAIAWSEPVRTALSDAGEQLNHAFADEPAVELIAQRLERRWREVHTAATDAIPAFRPVDVRLPEFIRKVDVVFTPDEAGRDRSLEDLSDGQRSLFHVAMTAATLDVEAELAAGTAKGFQPGGVSLPALTILAVEEPENTLSPFFLSRIIHQILDLTSGTRAQAVISSHSASILGRVDASAVRYFRLDAATRTSRVRGITLPVGQEEAAKFVREAVQTYPELYFANFVVLGEGASEEVVLPRISEAMAIPIDRSFVAIVPLGGRHVNHLWRLLADLQIPHATLLDLDYGREGGGGGRIKYACRELIALGTDPAKVLGAENVAKLGVDGTLAAIDSASAEGLNGWVQHLRTFGVFYCTPLDLDFSMLSAFLDAYKTLDAGMKGPSPTGDAKAAVLGEHGKAALYGPEFDERLRWYRYLFLGRGKPATHARVLQAIGPADLKAKAPSELGELVKYVSATLFPPVA